jgi:D-arabinose 1-dehydrogenase
MILEQTGRPLDIIQTYSHANLQNNTLPAFVPHFEGVAKVPIVMNASPLNMGLLTTAGGPEWHPAPLGMKACTRGLAGETPSRAQELGLDNVKIEDVAVSFGMREFDVKDGTGENVTRSLPVVVGVTSLEQVSSLPTPPSRGFAGHRSRTRHDLADSHCRQVVPRGKTAVRPGTR